VIKIKEKIVKEEFLSPQEPQESSSRNPEILIHHVDLDDDKSIA
jgi:hypothetical protein